MKENTPRRKLSWSTLEQDIQILARHLDETPWRGIIAIARGGLVPAAMLAQRLDVREVQVLSIASYHGQRQGAPDVLGRPDMAVVGTGAGWLLVDDLADTGATLDVARALLPDAHVATLYVKPAGADRVDTFAAEVPQDVWIDFPWEVDD